MAAVISIFSRQGLRIEADHIETNIMNRTSGSLLGLFENLARILVKHTQNERTWLKAGTEWKTESQMEWLIFVEKLYFTIVDLFCRYKSDNNKHIAETNCLRQCPRILIGKKNITTCA